MGIVLIVLGLIIWLFVNALIGLILVIIGLLLLFIPGPFYGYSWYRGRRGPP